jgi:hypothetical protein
LRRKISETEQVDDMEKRKADWGEYAKILWRFYRSGEKRLRKEYPETKEAMKAQRAMLNRTNYRHVYDVRITRRRNVLYLERSGVK